MQGLSLSRGGLAQLARAPALQAGGQGFESLILHRVCESDISSCDFIVAFFLLVIFHCGIGACVRGKMERGSLCGRGVPQSCVSLFVPAGWMCFVLDIADRYESL